MTIEIKPVPGHHSACLGFEHWPGGWVLFLGPIYVHWRRS